MSSPTHMGTSGHSGPPARTIHPGTSLVIDGRAMEVMEVTSHGLIQVQDMLTGEFMWKDYFVGQVVNPNEAPGALLDALGALMDEDVE